MTLQLCNIRKEYKEVVALNHINLTLHQGIYGLLGENGSGKSTLINILTGNLKPDEGTVLWDEKPIGQLGEKYRQCIGYVPQQQALYQDFTVVMFLQYITALKGLPREETEHQIDRVLEEIGLQEQRYFKIKTLSGGMKQRLLIGQSILGAPSVIIMDEPTVGLDPKQRVQLRELITKISCDKLVLIATHIVSDVEKIADEIIMIKKGDILCQGTVKELIHSVPKEEGDNKISSLEDVCFYLFED